MEADEGIPIPEERNMQSGVGMNPFQYGEDFSARPESNLVEYKLSAEELLSRIEHYLRGDIIKTKINENGEVESFYATPTKKVTTLVLLDKETEFLYYINEFDGERGNKWRVLSTISPEGEENFIEKDYGLKLAEEVKKRYNKGKFEKLKYVTKEVVDETKVNLSDYGVSEIMNILSMYVTKETFLSYYKEERINEILADVGDELNKFLFINGRKMGLNTEYKKTKYPIMVLTVLHAIESAYRRSIGGNENKNTITKAMISQDLSSRVGDFNQIRPPRKNLLKPSTW